MEQYSEGSGEQERPPLSVAEIESLKYRRRVISEALDTSIQRLLTYASYNPPVMILALRFTEGLKLYDTRVDLQDTLNACARTIKDAALSKAIQICSQVVDTGACLLESIEGTLAREPDWDFVDDDEVSDFLADVEALPAAAPPHMPEIAGLTDFAEMRAPDDQLGLIGGLLGCGTMGLIIGPPGHGKTFLAVDLGLAIATGLARRGKPTKAGAVLYINAEDAPGVHARVEAWKAKHAIDDAPFATIGLPYDLNTAEGGKRLLADVRKFEVRKRQRVGCVLIDTLARCTSGDENSGEVAARVVDNIDRIRRETGATVIGLHHVTKNGNSARGHGGVAAAADTIIRVSKGTCTVEKQRNGPDGWGFGFKIAPVFTAAGREIGAAIDYTPDAPPKPTAAFAVDDAGIMDALVSAVRAADGAGHPLKISKAGGLYQRRAELPVCLSAMKRDPLEALAKAAVARGFIHNNRGTLTAATKH